MTGLSFRIDTSNISFPGFIESIDNDEYPTNVGNRDIEDIENLSSVCDPTEGSPFYDEREFLCSSQDDDDVSDDDDDIPSGYGDMYDSLDVSNIFGDD